jgi:hypothetical protein
VRSDRLRRVGIGARKTMVVVVKLIQSIKNGLNCVGNERCRTDGPDKILDEILTVVFEKAIIRMCCYDSYCYMSEI